MPTTGMPGRQRCSNRIEFALSWIGRVIALLNGWDTHCPLGVAVNMNTRVAWACRGYTIGPPAKISGNPRGIPMSMIRERARGPRDPHGTHKGLNTVFCISFLHFLWLLLANITICLMI